LPILSLFHLCKRYLEEMTVSSKPLRMFMCAAVAAAFGTFGTATQATFYGGTFDPPTITGHFTGTFLLDVTDSCFSEGPCQIDLISLFINSGTFGSGWFSDGQENIASSASLDGGLHFLSVEIPLSNNSFDLVSTALDTLDQVTCNLCLQFTPDLGDDFFEHHGFIANFGYFNSEFLSGDNAIYVAAAVPEPGTLSLLVGGIGAAWLRRRRKTIA
jgi:hypothetical protein